MKKIIISLFITFLCLVAKASDYTYLVIKSIEGAEQTFSAQGLKFTFTDTEMNVSNGISEEKFYLSNLSSMYFSNSLPAGITSINKKNNFITINNGKIKIAAADGTKVKIYDTKGVVINEYVASDSNNEKALDNLSSGIYVININGVSTKISVK